MVEIHHRHDWDVSTDEAKQLQNQLREEIIREGEPTDFRFVAGADCSFRRGDDRAFGAVVVYDRKEEQIVERQTTVEPDSFPYVPGLLSFRELPALLRCFEQLQKTPEAIIADGHGYAHPRRFGLACHLGVFLEVPTLGCAKNVLVGEYETPGEERGNFEPLHHEGEQVGEAVRTRDRVNPVYVSSGHRVSLSSAREVVLKCGEGYKLPEPQRQADLAAGRLKDRKT